VNTLTLFVIILGIVGAPATVLCAFALWLRFNREVVDKHGVEALKLTPPVGAAFKPREWFRVAQPPGVTPPGGAPPGNNGGAP
jgi:hypothetical protein